MSDVNASTSMLEFLPNLPGYRSKSKVSSKKSKCLSYLTPIKTIATTETTTTIHEVPLFLDLTLRILTIG